MHFNRTAAIKKRRRKKHHRKQINNQTNNNTCVGFLEVKNDIKYIGNKENLLKATFRATKFIKNPLLESVCVLG